MQINVILGVNIDTLAWIKKLQNSKEDNIVVLDYHHQGKPIYIEDILYLSPSDAKPLIKCFENVKFHKSLSVYPGMAGKMSSLYGKQDK